MMTNPQAALIAASSRNEGTTLAEEYLDWLNEQDREACAPVNDDLPVPRDNGGLGDLLEDGPQEDLGAPPRPEPAIERWSLNWEPGNWDEVRPGDQIRVIRRDTSGESGCWEASGRVIFRPGSGHGRWLGTLAKLSQLAEDGFTLYVRPVQADRDRVH